MIRFILSLLLAGGLFAQTAMKTGGNTAVVSGNTFVNDDRDLVFDYDPAFGNGKTPRFQNRYAGGAYGLQQESNYAYPHSDSSDSVLDDDGTGELIEANSNDGNRVQLHIIAGYGFPSLSWFSNRNNDVWGQSFGRGRWITDRWSWGGTFVTGKLIMQINGKSIASSPLDFNEGLAVRTQTIGGGNAPGLSTNGGDGVVFIDPAPNTPKRIEHRWNRMMSNPNDQITSFWYVTELAGTYAGQTRSGWRKEVYSALPGGPVWHQWQTPDDTTTSREHWLDRTYQRRKWDYDHPMNLRLDMEALTGGITTGNIDLAPGHSWSGRTAKVGSSTAGWVITSAAQITTPCSVNLATDTGTVGARRDLTVTTAGNYFGTSRSSTITTSQTVTYLFRPANLSTGTSVITFFAGPITPANTNEQFLCVRQTNVGGQQKLELFNANASTTSGTNIDVTAGTEYAISVLYLRNGTGRLQVRLKSTGANVGSEVTLTCPNQSFGGWFVGSYGATTSQSNGVAYDIDNVCIDTNTTFLWPNCFWEYPNL